MAAETEVARLVARLVGDGKHFRAMLKQAETATKKTASKIKTALSSITASVGGRFGLAAGFTALTLSIRKATKDIDQMAKTARRLGIAVEMMGGLQLGAEKSGLELRTVTMAMQRMTRRAAEAAKGTGEAKDALAELGINAQRLVNMRPEQALRVVADALARVESQSDKVRLAFKLFDSEGVSMIEMLQDGSKGLDEFQKRAEQLGLTFSDQEAAKIERFNDTMTEFSSTIKGLGRNIATWLLPPWTEFLNSLSGRPSFGGFGPQFAADTAQAELVAAVDKLRELENQRDTLTKQLLPLGLLTRNTVVGAVDAQMQQQEAVVARLEQAYNDATQAVQKFNKEQAKQAKITRQQETSRRLTEFMGRAGVTGMVPGGARSRLIAQWAADARKQQQEQQRLIMAKFVLPQMSRNLSNVGRNIGGVLGGALDAMFWNTGLRTKTQPGMLAPRAAVGVGSLEAGERQAQMEQQLVEARKSLQIQKQQLRQQEKHNTNLANLIDAVKRNVFMVEPAALQQP